MQPLSDDVIAAYDAPFPEERYKAGVRAFPDLIPQNAENPASTDNQNAWELLERLHRPFLCAFSDMDPITAGSDKSLRERIPGAAGQPHTTMHGAGHFLQHDVGAELASLVVAWTIGGDPLESGRCG